MPGHTYGGPNGATYGGEDGSVYGTPLPRQVEGLTVQDTRAEEIDLTWDAAGSADEYAVFQAESSGSSADDYTEQEVVSETSVTLDGLTNGTTYYVRVVGRNARGDGELSSEVDTTTDLPATELTAIDGGTRGELTLTLNPQDNNSEGGIDVYRSTDGSLGDTVTTGLDPDTTEYVDDDDILDGERYDYTARRTTDDAESDSDQESEDAFLPDEDQPVLDNGVEDEVAVDREDAVSNNGDVRLQIREEESDTWDSDATGFDETTVAYDTLTHDFTGREDGEAYEVRARTETEHVEGEWTDPVAITTKFPGATDLSAEAVSSTEVELEWTDNADNEDGQDIIRERRVNGKWWPKETIADAGADTESYTDDTAQPDTTYRYRIRPYTDDTSAESESAEATTDDLGVPRRRIPASGWYVEVDHPNATAPLTPTVLGDGVEYPHRINDLPEISVEIPKSPRWLADEQLEDVGMRVWNNGDRLPIDTLENVRERPDKVVLEGAGGKALEQRIQTEYTDKAAHLATEEILDDIDFANEVDDPETETQSGDLMLSGDTTTEWDDALAEGPADDEVFVVEDGVLTTRQVGYFVEAEDADTQRIVEGTGIDDDTFSDGGLPYIEDAERNGAWGEFSHTFDLDHDIPDGEVEVGFRIHFPEYRPFHGYEIRIDGEEIRTVQPNDPDESLPSPYWDEATANIGGLEAGEHEITYIIDEEYDGDSDDDPINAVDCFGFWDARWADGFGNDVTDGVLEGDLYPDGVEVETDDAVTFLSIVAGELESEWNDTSGDQAVAISNDQGENWIEEENSESVDGEFDDGSAQIRARFRLSGFDDDPNTSPAGRTQPHEIDLFELFADLDDTPLIINKTYSQSVLGVLQDMAGDHSIFAVEWDDDLDESKLVWTQPGVRTSDADVSLTDYETAKRNEDSYERVVIRGQAKSIEEETITPDPDADIENDPIVEGNGRVYDDDGTVYTEGEDYELARIDGELTILDGGDMEDGEEYLIDYEYKVSGSYEAPNADEDAKTLEREVASIPSDRGCEQAALYLYRNVSEPLIEAEVDLTDLDPRQSIVDTINIDALPTGGQRVEIREATGSDQRPSLRLGNRRSAGEVLDDIRSQLQAVSRLV